LKLTIIKKIKPS